MVLTDTNPIQAGLPALGSSYSPRLPTGGPAVANADFVPDYGGGTASDFNGIPY